MTVPDLLSAQPRVRVDLGAIKQALVFSFAVGGSVDAIDDAIAGAALPPSSWDPRDFAGDVYLDELVARAMPLRIGGKSMSASARYLARAIGAPPSSPRDAEARREALRELAGSPSARADLEDLYLRMVRLRDLLGLERAPAPRARRVEILRASREVFEHMASAFAGASSPLARLRAFGERVVGGAAHARVVALLDHDDDLASLDLRVRFGADGEVRAMAILGVQENRDNPFHVSWLRRVVVRLMLLFRGYRTTSDEVAERLLTEVFSGIEDDVALLFQVMGDAAVLLASLGLRDRAADLGLGVCLPEMGEAGGALELEGLFNPLLLAAGVTPVACDLRAGPGAVVLVTGPNSGGKTRLLQAIAINQMLAEGGLFAPIRAGRVPRATALLASLHEERQADAPEGHLGMELLRIRRLFEELDFGALVVLDELCSGTSPIEGEEIALLVISLLPELGVQAFVTTHLLGFAARLSQQRPVAGLDFLQVELDARERPTYRFVPGVATTSLAQRTAARLGVSREHLLEVIAKKRSRRPPSSGP